MDTRRETIPTGPADCRTLAEWREWGLRETQDQVARTAGCRQAWISQVERGHLPRPKAWARLVKAYRLENAEAEFVRMVRAGAALAAAKRQLQAPLAETHPLFAAAQGEAKELLTTETQRHRAQRAG